MINGPHFYMIPFEGYEEEVVQLAKWKNDPDYKYFFRHMPQVIGVKQLANYPQLLGAQVVLLRANETQDIIGMATFSPDNKTNKAVFTGILIDKSYQNKRYPAEAFIMLYNHLFNDLGYRKAIIEIVEDHIGLKKTITENKFFYEGKLVGECYINGEFVNELRYCMMDTFFNKHYKPILDKWSK